MKFSSFAGIPWDVCVIMSITLGGFGFSANRLMEQHRVATENLFSAGDTLSAEKGVLHGSVLDMGCVDLRDSARIASQQASVRLRGKLCSFTRAELKGFNGLLLKNTSTGSEGTVFFHGSQGSFVTDVLPLQAGKNSLRLEWQEPSGQKRILLTEIYTH